MMLILNPNYMRYEYVDPNNNEIEEVRQEEC